MRLSKQIRGKMIAKLNFGQIILIIIPKARKLLVIFVIFIAKSRKKIHTHFVEFLCYLIKIVFV